VALFNLAHKWRYPIPLLNDRAISAGGRQFCPIFGTKLVAMSTSLKISEKGGRIDHLPFNIYHMVQRMWKLVQRILRYFGSERTSTVQNKIGCHGNVPWGIRKNGPDQENSRKYLPFGEKIVKIDRVDTEIALLPVKKTRNAWQSLAHSVPQCRPLASSSETKPCSICQTAKNACSISLPSLQQSYLVAMAAPLTNWRMRYRSIIGM